MSAPRPPQPPEMQIIARKRRQSIRQAAISAGISEARWRQLEGGFRSTPLGPVPEAAPDGTLARMAYAVGATADDLREARRDTAAALLEAYAAERAAIDEADEEAADAGARAVAEVAGLTARQRARLAAMLTEDLKALRAGSD